MRQGMLPLEWRSRCRGRIAVERRAAQMALTGLVSSSEEGAMEGCWSEPRRGFEPSPPRLVTTSRAATDSRALRLGPGKIPHLDRASGLQARRRPGASMLRQATLDRAD